MATLEEQIKDIEEEINTTKYNKATQHHIGKLKAKLAKLRRESEKRSGGGGGGRGFSMRKSGDATVSLVGMPSAGKSTLLNQITGANSEVGNYAFTTLTVIPGAFVHRGANIQVFDLPGLIEGASKGRGMGREVLAAARNSDLVLLVADAFQYDLKVLLRELFNSGIRMNQKRADIAMSPRERGGLQVNTTLELTKIDEEMILEMVRAYGHVNGDIVVREDIDTDQLVDFLAGNRVYPKAFVILNKIDLVDEVRKKEILSELEGWRVVEVSAKEGVGIEELKNAIFDSMEFIRIFMKPQGQTADMEEPLVIRKGATVGEVCNSLHRDFKRKFRYALVWGVSAKFPGQTVGLDHVMMDSDVLSIIIHRS